MRAMLALSWPMILTNLGQTAMTATDVLMMGRLGPKALAAGSLGSNIYFLPLIFGLGLMLAVSPMIATELGRKRHAVRDVRRTVRQGLWSALAISVVACRSGAALERRRRSCAPWARTRRSPPLAGGYLRTLQCGACCPSPVLPRAALLHLAALERPGLGAPGRSSSALVGFNVDRSTGVLMYGNLGVPALGLPGSGLATTLASLLDGRSGLPRSSASNRRFRRYRLFGRWWVPDWPRLAHAALEARACPSPRLLTFEVSDLQHRRSFMMGLIGTPLARRPRHRHPDRGSITFMVPMGFAQAATVRVGKAFGARNRDEIHRAGWAAFVLGIGFMVLTAVLMLVVPRLMIGAFIDVDDPANATVVGFAVSFLAIAALFQVADGAQVLGAGMLRGLHDTRLPMLFALAGYWGLGLPIGVALGFWTGLGGVGIWIGLAAGLAVVAVLMMRRWLRRETIGLVPTEI
jgi:MATE family multidrug resistance protein